MLHIEEICRIGMYINHLAHIKTTKMNIQTLIILLVIFLCGCKQNSIKETVSKTALPTDLKKIGKLLDSIHVEDQKYRREIKAINQEYGWESDEMRNHWNKISKTDSSNLVVVEQILEKHGWLSSEEIGSTANSTLFLVIQHSSQEAQEKYLPMMRQAVKEGKANSRSLALLEDRLGLAKGELQVYGSQIGTDQESGEMYVLPLIDPENVNERRSKVGLDPIEDYISHWNLEWDVEEYKKKLPKWIENLKAEKR